MEVDGALMRDVVVCFSSRKCLVKSRAGLSSTPEPGRTPRGRWRGWER
jgi:hypothetical protein